MEFEIKQQWSIPLIISYVGSIYMYTMFNSAGNNTLTTIFLLAVIATLIYSLYIIWQKYSSEERTRLFTQLAIFAVVLHVITIPMNYFFGGIIGFLVGLLIIYFFFKHKIKM